jgi:2-iminobutanoate/2-iminopropanoate deaminase
VGRDNPQAVRPGALFSGAVVAEGPFVFVSGQGAIRDGERVVGTIEEETRLTLENIGRVLAEVGAGLGDVVRCNVYLAELDDFPGMNTVYQEAFADPKPARTTVGVALVRGMRVEIDCIARVPNS